MLRAGAGLRHPGLRHHGVTALRARDPDGDARRAAERRGEVERNSIDVQPGQLAQPRVTKRHQCEGRDEVLAELPVGDPRLPWRQALEGQRIDEDRARALKLDIVGAGIFQRHTMLHREQLNLKGQQRRVPELPGLLALPVLQQARAAVDVTDQRSKVKDQRSRLHGQSC